ncbi:sugar phosphate isomerase/epimerase family protein [Shimia sagamensis]|uniref:Sugar phosphate isomerase/epimerase n=1 Tax=Shimia sagamensis TaxID=1566352 RepID=A0ABY1PG06_9RHOB|nr:sugar phosphate isomerase/epimerase [Shimia sagamensis]SMP33570.1 Sugar phosphate isomerase/epimerase [Shimia sagamensis]
MSFSFQLYSSRNVASQEIFLSQLAELGYTSVEGYGGVYDDPQSFFSAMSASGLTMPSGHFGINDLRDNFDNVMMLADTFGIKHVIVPYLEAEARPTDKAGWQALARELSEIGAKVRETGRTFSWHNHDFEFEALEDGSYPMDIILRTAPDISWEADLGWVARAGLDPAPIVEKYADRLIAVHVKDIAKAGEGLDEDGWSDIGEGVMDWPGLIRQIRAQAPNALLIAEQDNPSDAVRFASVSMANLKDI